jgi:AraC family transcriptional regulator of adaptative response / DNA-3-methyladenine glycosylase II
LGARLRRLFDLDARPRTIAAHLSTDRKLAPLVARRRGLRAPGAFDPFELAVRAVLGQQISVRGATTLAGRLAASIGEPVPPSGIRLAALNRFPITAGRLAEARPASIAGLGITRARARCLIALARATAEGELPELLSGHISNDPMSLVHRLQTLPGIGPWTAMYIAMRGLGWRDAFPDGDLGLRKAMGDISPARLRLASERWRPWRAYAAQHLWAGLADRAA